MSCGANQASEMMEGEIFLMTKAERFNQHWLVLMGNEIYFFRAKDDPTHLFMHSLAGTFVKEQPQLPPEQSSLWPIKIIFQPTKSRILYFTSQNDRNKWLAKLTEATGQANIHDFYNIERVIGKGQFGEVKIARHKRTGNKVAIKMMAKANMKLVEAQQTRREIEVMKMSKHPNVVRLVDFFEDADNFYLVLELMNGGDLFDYLKARSFRLPEDRAREVIY